MQKLSEIILAVEDFMKMNREPFVADIQFSLSSIMAVRRRDWISRFWLSTAEIWIQTLDCFQPQPSRNTGLAEVWRDLCKSSGPTPPCSRTITRWILSIPRDGDSTSVGNSTSAHASIKEEYVSVASHYPHSSPREKQTRAGKWVLKWRVDLAEVTGENFGSSVKYRNPGLH